MATFHDTYTVRLEISGRTAYCVDDADRTRGENAALSVFEAAGCTPAAAMDAFEAQWQEFDSETPMTGLARTYLDARDAAQKALTETWLVPTGGDVWVEGLTT